MGFWRIGSQALHPWYISHLFGNALSFPLEDMGTDKTNPAFCGLEGALYTIDPNIFAIQTLCYRQLCCKKCKNGSEALGMLGLLRSLQETQARSEIHTNISKSITW